MGGLNKSLYNALYRVGGKGQVTTSGQASMFSPPLITAIAVQLPTFSHHERERVLMHIPRALYILYVSSECNDNEYAGQCNEKIVAFSEQWVRHYPPPPLSKIVIFRGVVTCDYSRIL